HQALSTKRIIDSRCARLEEAAINQDRERRGRDIDCRGTGTEWTRGLEALGTSLAGFLGAAWLNRERRCKNKKKDKASHGALRMGFRQSRFGTEPAQPGDRRVEPSRKQPTGDDARGRSLIL